jgi:hypothetical protein
LSAELLDLGDELVSDFFLRYINSHPNFPFSLRDRSAVFSISIKQKK